ncbi:hypothetical protein MD484_g3556, partial [Candolleomyces efflorescens]
MGPLGAMDIMHLPLRMVEEGIINPEVHKFLQAPTRSCGPTSLLSTQIGPEQSA